MELGITTTPTAENYVISVAGEVDISNVAGMRDHIDLALEQPTAKITLDFSHVSYIDSTGIGVLVGAAHHAVEHQKGFEVVNAQPNVMRVAQLLGVDKKIGITGA